MINGLHKSDELNMESKYEEHKDLTFVRTSGEKITYYLDLASKGLRRFCIVCEIILLAVFIPLVSGIPLEGTGITLVMDLVLLVPIPLTILLTYGVIASFRKREITVDRSTNQVSLTMQYANIRRNRIYPFENIAAILLESLSGEAPSATQARGNAAWEELIFIYANGKRESIATTYGNKLLPRNKNIYWLKNELVRDILVDIKRPVAYLSERVKIVKSPGIDGETVFEISKARTNVKIVAFMITIFMIIVYWGYLILMVVTMTFLSDSSTFTFIGQMMSGVIFLTFGIAILYYSIKYRLEKSARDYIMVNENTGFLTFKNKRGRVKMNLKVNDIQATSLAVHQSRDATDYCPVLKMIDGRDLDLYKSDHLLEAKNLSQLLGIIISHATLKQQDPNVPPLPMLTYDVLSQKHGPYYFDIDNPERTWF